MKRIIKVFVTLVLLVGVSCDLDKDLENPNEVRVGAADVNLIMNQVQLDFAAFFARAAGNDVSAQPVATVGADQLVRMNAMTGGDTYDRAIAPQNMDQVWTLAYQNVLVNIDVLLPLAEEKNLTTHIAAAKIMKAYVLMTLVDLFGDVPNREALKGNEGIFNPNVDPGQQVYDDAIVLLNEARTELAKTGSEAGNGLTRDIYYGGDRTKWTALANTLELKAWLNVSVDPARKTEATERVNTLLSANLIDTEAENFVYKYGTADVPVRSRHPLYRQYYKPQAGAATGYIGNYFLKEAFNGKGVEDPRWRYYFYRQVGSIQRALQVDRESVPCVLTPKPDHYGADQPFCVFEPGFFGRDHGNNDGGPPDQNVITCVGVYPAGGRLDLNNGNANYFDDTIQGDGANGAGIEPIFMSFFTDFIKAEVVLRLGLAGDARQHLVNGINHSIEQVKNFANSRGQTLPASLEPSTTAYLDAVLARYDASGADRLDVAMKEFYLSLWGNGVEAFNLYRRTSSPRNLQPTRALNSGIFFRSLWYPAIFVNLNDQVAQKTDGNAKVFWDKNPDALN